MAVNSTMLNKTIKVEYKVGVDESGKDLLKTQSFSTTKIDTTDQDAYDFAIALNGVLLFPVLSVEIINKNELTEV
ncbi:MAG: DUF1659 domain-containing protein [Clostridiaceae bacterium]